MTAHKMEKSIGQIRFMESVMPVVSKSSYYFGAFAYSRKAFLTFLMPAVLSVCPSACISVSPTGRISVKFDPGHFLMKTYRGNPNLVEIG